MKSMWKTFLTVLMTAGILCALTVVSGCSDDDPVAPGSVPTTGAETPDELVSYFLAAYGNRDIISYLAILDPDFSMILTDDTIQDFPGIGSTLDYSKEERIHQRMFSGDDVTDPNGYLIPGIEEISFEVFNPMGAWSATDDEVNFPETVWAPYQVVIRFDRGPQSYSSRTEGLVKIYARSHEVLVDGQPKTYFLMAGVTDLTGLYKGSETIAWGSIKALYR